MRTKHYVYFIRQGHFVKVGTAINPPDRLRRLQQGSPHPLTLALTLNGSRALEQRLHKRFARLRVRGEWFKYEGKLKSYMEKLVNL